MISTNLTNSFVVASIVYEATIKEVEYLNGKVESASNRWYGHWLKQYNVANEAHNKAWSLLNLVQNEIYKEIDHKNLSTYEVFNWLRKQAVEYRSKLDR